MDVNTSEDQEAPWKEHRPSPYTCIGTPGCNPCVRAAQRWLLQT